MSDEENKGDLSGLISAPPQEEAGDTAAPAPEPTSNDPVEFESLDELSKKAINQHEPTATSEKVISGMDMSLVDTDSPPQEQPLSDIPGLGPDLVPDMPLAAEAPAPAETATEFGTEAVGTSTSTSTSIDSIKSYSENLVAADAQIAAAFPFTLKIDGKLTAEETEKLLTILARENMGFREVDLETQIAEGRILIPRISEYAGIVLIQALRGISAKMYFGPSDEIFSTPETRADYMDASAQWTTQDELVAQRTELEDMPVSNTEHLPQFKSLRVIDTVITSGLLSTRSLEAASSEEYTTLLEALIRELKFKARRRGANGILSLQITLTPLTLPTDFRVTVTGSAVSGS